MRGCDPRVRLQSLRSPSKVLCVWRAGTLFHGEAVLVCSVKPGGERGARWPEPARPPPGHCCGAPEGSGGATPGRRAEGEGVLCPLADAPPGASTCQAPCPHTQLSGMLGLSPSGARCHCRGTCAGEGPCADPTSVAEILGLGVQGDAEGLVPLSPRCVDRDPNRKGRRRQRRPHPPSSTASSWGPGAQAHPREGGAAGFWGAG